MAQTLDLGSRVELVSMDPHCDDISIALYAPDSPGQPCYQVHTYSRRPGAVERVAGVARAMQVLGGMEPITAGPIGFSSPCCQITSRVAHAMQALRGMGPTTAGPIGFSCGHAHRLAVKRLFLEACKLPPAQPLQPRPLHIFDKKANATIVVASLGQGLYEARATEQTRGIERRVATIARGLIRLGEMDEVAGQPNQAQFGCGVAHDALIGLLLARAPNVRAAVREAEAMASRGVLSAPSAQE